MNVRVLLSHRARRVFIWLHLWLGLSVGLWFSLIGLTGSVLAWRGELTALELRAKFPLEKPSATAPIISVNEAISRVQNGSPDAKNQPLTVTIPNSRMPFYSVVQGRARRGKMVLIDPYSGRVHADVNTRATRIGTIQQFHQRLIAGARGYVVNGLFNVLAIPLVLSGLWLWWPRNMAQLKARLQVKRGASLKRKLYDLHNVLGIYLYGLLSVTTLTGAMLVYQHIAADGGLRAFLSEETQAPANNARGENRGENATPKVPVVGARLSNEKIVEIARGLRPQWELTRLQLPAQSNEAITATFQKPLGLTNSETVALNPYSGQIINTTARDEGFSVRSWTRLLHLGEFGGVLSKLLYTFTGLMPLGLFVTGVWMWASKKFRKKAPQRVVVTEAELVA